MRKRLTPAQRRVREYNKSRWIKVGKLGVFIIMGAAIAFTILAIIGHKTYPNIVLVTVDSFRPDHLSLFGYQRETTPNLKKIAAKGISFNRFYTTVPRAAGAAVSMLTGRYPQNLGFRVTMASLSKAEKTLTKYLKIYEYQTAAFSSNPVVSPSRGIPVIDQAKEIEEGFDYFMSVPKPIIAEQLTDKVLAWLKDHHAKRFFTWVHYHDPARPYRRFPFTKTSDRGWEKNLSLLEFNRYGMIASDRMFERDYTENQKAATIDRYDADIKAVDTQLGRIDAFLKNNGLTKNTILIIAGLHGENLGDHFRTFGHGEFLYDVTIKVPLVIRYPKGLPDSAEISEVARIIDLAPTILSMADVKHKPELMDGKSLYPLMKGDEKVFEEKAFVESGETFFPDYKKYRKLPKIAGYSRAIIAKDKKLIMTPLPEGNRYELYDLEKDPLEKQTLIDNPKYMDLFEKLKNKLTGWIRFDRDQEDKIESSIEQRLKLYSLGYLQSPKSKLPNKFIKTIQQEIERKKREAKKKKFLEMRKQRELLEEKQE